MSVRARASGSKLVGAQKMTYQKTTWDEQKPNPNFSKPNPNFSNPNISNPNFSYPNPFLKILTLISNFSKLTRFEGSNGTFCSRTSNQFAYSRSKLILWIEIHGQNKYVNYFVMREQNLLFKAPKRQFHCPNMMRRGKRMFR